VAKKSCREGISLPLWGVCGAGLFAPWELSALGETLLLFDPLFQPEADSAPPPVITILTGGVLVALLLALLLAAARGRRRRAEEASSGARRAEKALAESEERYRDLVDASEDWVFTHDLEGFLLSANQAMTRQTGYSREELLEKNLSDLLIPQLRDEFASSLDTLAREGYAGGFMRVLTRNGEERILEYQSSLCKGEAATPVVSGIAHDVQRRWAERVLRLSLSRLEALLNNIPDVAWLKDERGRFIAVNEACARFLNRTTEEIIGKTDADFLPLEVARRFQESDREVMETGRSLQVTEEVRSAQGRPILFETIKTPIRSAGGTPSGTAGIARDITERRRLEEQLVQSQKMEAVGRLSGGIAHDFNNLLTTVLGYSDLLLGQLERDSPLRPDLEEIKKAGERAAGLTRQLLAFSRKQVIEPKVLELNAIVSGASKMLRRLIGENVELMTILEPGLGRVRADPGQIEQVLVNLAVNARDAMPEGGKLAVETKNLGFYEPYPSAYTRAQPGPYVLLAVSDTGSGMDAETQSHIFEPFYTTKERGQGTGLGLATVYGIVKQSGGDIWVSSELGRGTTFKVCLPRVDEPADQLEAVQPPGEIPRGSETILLVEDEEGLRALARRVLEANGYTVLPAGSAEEALEIADRGPSRIHLLLTDVVLPRTNGIQLAQRLSSRRPELKVLYISGYTDSAPLPAASAGEQSAFLQKPFTPAVLIRKVREVLRAA